MYFKSRTGFFREEKVVENQYTSRFAVTKSDREPLLYCCRSEVDVSVIFHETKILSRKWVYGRENIQYSWRFAVTKMVVSCFWLSIIRGYGEKYDKKAFPQTILSAERLQTINKYTHSFRRWIKERQFIHQKNCRWRHAQKIKNRGHQTYNTDTPKAADKINSRPDKMNKVIFREGRHADPVSMQWYTPVGVWYTALRHDICLRIWYFRSADVE